MKRAWCVDGIGPMPIEPVGNCQKSGISPATCDHPALRRATQ